MRQPTPHAVAYKWWTDELAGGNQVVTDEPQCGYFKRRLVKDGPFVPCAIYLAAETDPETGELLGDERLVCLVGGRRANADYQWTWICGRPITKAEYDFMIAERRWAERYSPDEPAANPRAPIDWNKVPIPF